MKKKVYLAFTSDILHRGHINILKQANKLGEITVGLLTDKAIGSYKKIPFLNYEQREIILKNLKLVHKVIPQDTLDYRPNLKKLKPHFVVHGDDWKKGILKNTRKQVVIELRKWSGKLVEVAYTKNIASNEIQKNNINLDLNKVNRTSLLRRLIRAKKFVRIIEAHSPLSALIAERVQIKKREKLIEFDGFWSSSLTDSLLRGKPDNQSVDLSVRIAALNEILDITSKPIIFDGDNGGRVEHLPYTINSMERQGVSAIVLEDKAGLKKNSLFSNQTNAKQDTIKNFSNKISVAVNSRKSRDFLIVARIESLILKNGMKDAIKRANIYSKAGADAILIHSKNKDPKEIFQFAKIFRKSKYYKPMIAVPSSYSKTFEKDLIKNDFKIVIYANHVLRASYLAMNNVLKSILKNERSYESEKNISPISELLKYSLY
ncbi:phosphoenolpyruvate mutase [Candidatus Pelagibacter sp.]|nr:phosphoenolpyruvate mutase [Candidatus Pelagibacter sp.]